MASKAADDVPSPSSSPSPPSAHLSTSEHRLQLSTETSSGSRNCPIGPSSLHRLQKQMAPPIIQSHLEINESPLEHRNKDERDELIPSSRSPRHRQPTCHTAKKKIRTDGAIPPTSSVYVAFLELMHLRISHHLAAALQYAIHRRAILFNY